MVQNGQRGKLSRLKYENGKYFEIKEDLETELIRYYGTIMEEDHRDMTEDIRNITRHISRQVLSHQNESL